MPLVEEDGNAQETSSTLGPTPLGVAIVRLALETREAPGLAPGPDIRALQVHERLVWLDCVGPHSQIASPQ